jgi:nitrous oxidase accessory protein NosD
MQKKTWNLMGAAIFLALVFSASPQQALGAVLKTSDYGGDLAVAINAASEGDRIIVDIPSFPGFSGGTATINKRLEIVGAPSGLVEGRFVIGIGGSGSALRHLKIQGSGIGIGVNGPNADDVTVANCTIEGFRTGVRGRFSDRWHVHENTIITSNGGSLTNNSAGIVLNAGVDDWSIHHNTILAEIKGVYLFNSAPDPTAIADIVIMNNVIMTSDLHGVGVFLHSFNAGGLQKAVEIKHNDLLVTKTPVLVYAASVTEDHRADPGAFVLSTVAAGVIEDLNVRKNLSAP